MDALPDLIGHVCGFLDLEDLFNAVLVSKDWNYEATRFIWELALVNWRILALIGHVVQETDSLTIKVSFSSIDLTRLALTSLLALYPISSICSHGAPLGTISVLQQLHSSLQRCVP